VSRDYDPNIRSTLITNAKEMLQKFLTNDREQRVVKGKALKPDERCILRVET
jgi:hypothetical protein